MGSRLRGPASTFAVGGRTDPWLVALFVGIHAILLFNALVHDPRVAYDAGDHLSYIKSLAQLRLPSRDETLEFFSPPLPYVPAALLVRLGDDPVVAMKWAQIANVGYSMILCVCLLGICESLRPGSRDLKLLALGLLGMLPVYYRSFAFVRGEPLLAAAVLFSMASAIRLFATGPGGDREALVLGLGLGTAVLSRQMGFFVLPAVALLALAAMVRQPHRRAAHLRALALGMAVAATAGGWYYAHLYADYGTVAVLNRDPSEGSLASRQPRQFFTDLALDRLFSDPIRPSFPNRLLPIFYSETWGDYWCYFHVWGRNEIKGRFVTGRELESLLASSPSPPWLTTNRYEVGRYLGRVNIVSLLPSAILLAGFLLALPAFAPATKAASDPAALVRALMAGVVAITMMGYLWFLLEYPSPKTGRTIKATYVLQMFPPLCLLAADLMLRIRQRSAAAYRILQALLIACALHNFPVLFTHLLPW